jgi:RNA polymerase sigma-70 factor (ECF subfamily)
MSGTDEDELIRRAQQGDVRAFERLIETHIAQLRRFARAFARHEQDADDLAQEALIKIYRSLGSYRFQSAFSTWFFAVTRNCFLDTVKRRGRDPISGDEAVGTAPLADELLEQRQDRQRLWTAIQKIPLEYRTALVLFDIEGMSYEEVARVERVPLGTIKSRLSRAREHLRGLLKRDDSRNQERAEVVSPTERRNQR